MTIRDTLARSVRATLVDLGIDPVPDVVHLERPARPEHGDWSTNVALAVAKAAGRNPRDLAAAVRERLLADPPPHVSAVEVAGPGFVNFRLEPGWLHDALVDVVSAGTEGYARHAAGGGERVNVEFVSANPTGPLHVASGRHAAYGDSLCRILELAGHEVDREYYVNDRGLQMTLFVESLVARKAGNPVPDGGYQGQYVADWAAEMPDDADPRGWGYERVTRDLADTLAAIGVTFDTWFSERSLVDNGTLDATLRDLAAAGALYDADGATWFRATEHGDRQDHVLVKSDGEPTYLLSDIAYHRDKFARGFPHLIDVWGADHHGHVKRLKAAVEALGHDPEHLEILLGQLVTLQRGGVVVRIGKRSGDFVELAEVLEEVGPDVARLIFLLQSIDTRQTFDLDVVRRQSMDNPVYYLQYAHARELDLLRSLADLPDVVLAACLDRGPHRVTSWVLELAGRFHGFYHDCSILGPDVDPEVAQARLWLVEATRVGLSVGLDLLGVSAPESM